jgi:hypothetical protein
MSETGRGILRGPGPTFASIHRSAWNRYSRKLPPKQMHRAFGEGIMLVVERMTRFRAKAG